MRLVLPLALLGLPLMAQAQQVEAWHYDGFSGRGKVAGWQTWENGYAADEWRRGDGSVHSTTDHSSDDAPGGFGEGGAVDNWVVHNTEVRNGSVYARLFNYDNDSAGVVFQHSGSGTFYLAAHTAHSAPWLMGQVDTGTVYLIRVDGGAATLLGSGHATHDDNEWNHLWASVIDGHIQVHFNDVLVVEASDDAWLPAGKAGLYAYNNGGTDNRTGVYFAEAGLWFSDRDEDTVVDDDDNCIDEPNKGQSDRDGDGLGDLCDPTPDGDADTDTDTDTDADTDTDSDTDTDGVGSHSVEDPERVTGSCGCAVTTGPAAGLWMMGLLVVGLRRRRA